MDGWVEWIVYTILMVLAGVGIVLFFTSPLLAILSLAGIGLAFWVVGPTRRAR